MANDPVTIFLKLSSSGSAWDWELLRSLLGQLAGAGLLKEVKWIQKEYEDGPVTIPAIPVSNTDQIFQQAVTQLNGSIYFLFGDKEEGWEILWTVDPFNKNTNRVDGINTFFLQLNCAPATVDATAGKLAGIFEKVCDPLLIEYGTIHTYKEWVLDETVPVTIAPMFRAVYWANFLGEAHLREFDLNKLKSIPAWKTRWTDEKGLLFYLCGHLSNCKEEEIQEQAKQLTALFRDAILPTSKWK